MDWMEYAMGIAGLLVLIVMGAAEFGRLFPPKDRP